MVRLRGRAAQDRWRRIRETFSRASVCVPNLDPAHGTETGLTIRLRDPYCGRQSASIASSTFGTCESPLPSALTM